MAGWVALIAGVGAMFLILLNINARVLDRDTDSVLSVLAPILIIGGFFILLRGRRLSLVDANFVLSSSELPPIIYLRSFGDDLRDRRRGNILALISPAMAAHTWEGHVAGVIKSFGPFVAIGRPGEPLPELGAARMYVDDDQWQATVFDLLGRCKAAVLRGGDTEGLRWELGEVLKVLEPRQVLLMLPSNAAQFEKFRAWANQVLPKPIPEQAKAPFLMFDDDWTPVPLKQRRGFGTWFRGFLSPFRAGVGLTETLASFLARLDPEAWGLYDRTEARLFRRRRNIFAAGLALLLTLVIGAAFWSQAQRESALRKRQQIQQLMQEQQRELERLDRGPGR